MLEMRRLRLLRELKLRGTIGAVADALSFSPSSVSQQLAQLEREAGVPLLRRVGRRVVLTPQAEILVEHTTALLERLERAETEVNASLANVSGTIRVAAFQSALLALVPPALTILRDDYPDLRVEITMREPESGLHDVWARDHDLVIAEQYPAHAAPRPADLDREELCVDPLRLGLPPGRDDVRSISDARRLPWVMEPAGTASRHFAEQVCRVAGFEPDVRYVTADLQAHIDLVRGGHAASVLPDLVWAGREPDVRLIGLPGSPRRTVFTSSRVGSWGTASRSEMTRPVKSYSSRSRPVSRACDPET
ncbi:LysR family transcriptional regulator, partial [Clavibacter michiganensis]|uniref:LysR family transcriptional regulator n=1 Tax=Clavibacter michiganensis TaxID=28447 RepID=UPI00292E9F42